MAKCICGNYLKYSNLNGVRTLYCRNCNTHYDPETLLVIVPVIQEVVEKKPDKKLPKKSK